jgi:hypothetical protein
MKSTFFNLAKHASPALLKQLPTWTLSTLTLANLNSGAAFMGYLYNTGLGKYVNLSSDGWIYAKAATLQNAIKLCVYKSTKGNTVVQS